MTMAFLLTAWTVVQKVFGAAITFVEGSPLGALVIGDIKKIAALFVVDAVLIGVVLFPFVGLKAILLSPLAAAVVMIPEVVEQFYNGFSGK